jgi:hypothetical protein
LPDKLKWIFYDAKHTAIFTYFTRQNLWNLLLTKCYLFKLQRDNNNLAGRRESKVVFGYVRFVFVFPPPSRLKHIKNKERRERKDKNTGGGAKHINKQNGNAE